MLGSRASFYAIFEALNCAVTISGQSYNGTDSEAKTPKFDRMIMGNPKYTELSIFMEPAMKYWNTPIGVWSSYCVESRISMTNPITTNLKMLMFSLNMYGFHPSILCALIFIAISGGIFNDIKIKRKS